MRITGKGITETLVAGLRLVRRTRLYEKAMALRGKDAVFRRIDLGPEDGDAGGRIAARGTPEDVAAVRASFTGHLLAPLLGVPRAKAS